MTDVQRLTLAAVEPDRDVSWIDEVSFTPAGPLLRFAIGGTGGVPETFLEILARFEEGSELIL